MRKYTTETGKWQSKRSYEACIFWSFYAAVCRARAWRMETMSGGNEGGRNIAWSARVEWPRPPWFLAGRRAACTLAAPTFAALTERDGPRATVACAVCMFGRATVSVPRPRTMAYPSRYCVEWTWPMRLHGEKMHIGGSRVYYSLHTKL